MAIILIVEDDADSAELMRRWLTPHEVTICADAFQASEWLSRSKAQLDLALLDIDLPLVKGNALRGIIERRNPAAVIVACTGSSRAQATALGFQHYLGKPVRLETFAAEVARLLSGAAPAGA